MKFINMTQKRARQQQKPASTLATRPMRRELTVSCESASRKNYLGYCVSVVVLLFMSTLIVGAIVMINPEIGSVYSRSFAPREAVSIEEAMLGELAGNYHPVHWAHKRLNSGLWAPVAAESGALDELQFEDGNKNIYIISLKQTKDNSTQRSDFETVKFSKGHNQLRWNYDQQQVLPNITTLVTNSSLLASFVHQGYRISPSKRYLLVWNSKRKQFRYSWSAKFFVYDIKLDEISLLSTQNSPAPLSSYENLYSASQYMSSLEAAQDEQYTRFQSVEWYSPSPSEVSSETAMDPVDSLIMLQNNDIYLLPELKLAKEKQSMATASNSSNANNFRPIRVSFTGKQGEIFNGLPDWLYEEEILSDRIAYQISGDGNALAYMSFNDSQVDEVPYSVYEDYFVPRVKRLRYPRAGRINPTVKVYVIDKLASFASLSSVASGYSSLFSSLSFTNNDVGDIKTDYRAIELVYPDGLGDLQHYVTQIKWLTRDKLAVVWLNRQQELSYILTCARQSNWSCQKNLELRPPGAGWLEMSDSLVALDEQSYLMLMYKFHSEEVGAYKQVARVSLDKPNTFTYLTSAPREAIKIDGIDKKRSLVYYTATPLGEPGQRQVYYVSYATDLAQDTSSSSSSCLTCELYPNECQYNGIQLSRSASFYIFECDGPSVPRFELYSVRKLEPSAPNGPAPSNNNPSNIGQPAEKAGSQTDNNSTATSLLWTIEDNHELRDKLTRRKAMPLTMRLKVPIRNTNYSAQVVLLLPPQLGPRATFKAPQGLSQLLYQQRFGPTASRNKRQVAQQATKSTRPSYANVAARQLNKQPALAEQQQASEGVELPLESYLTRETIAEFTRQLAPSQQYPMVVDVYAGPGSQLVDYRYRIHFGHYLASSRRIIYAMIDARGSGYQGTRRLYELYHKFGSVEIEDQVEVAGALSRQFSFIDPSKVAIWGWSYGGYVSAMALARSNAVTKLNFRQQQSPATGSANSSLMAQSPIAASGVFECAASVAPVTNWIYYDSAYTERYMSSPYLNNQFDLHTSGDHLKLNHGNATNLEASGKPGLLRKTGNEARQLTLVAGDKQQANLTLPSLNFAAEATSLDTALANTSPPNSVANIHGNIKHPGSNLGNNNVYNNLTKLSEPDLNGRYQAASLLEHVANIDRKRFLLIHGTADDNVHFQQSIMLMKKMIQSNIMFESRIYPDQDHGIANRPDKLHLATTLTNFFSNCFDLPY